MDYFHFIKKYYPYCKASIKINLVHEKIEENNILLQILINHIKTNYLYLNNDKLVFLNRYMSGINKILLYIPLNDDIGVDACMRFSIEQVLKFIYSIYFDKSAQSINKTSYRNIKDDFKNIKSEIDIIYDDLSKLNTYYGKYSNNIHKSCYTESDDLYYLADILTKNDSKISTDIYNDLTKIFKIVDKIIIDIFDIKIEALNISERLRLSNGLSNRRYKYIDTLLRV